MDDLDGIQWMDGWVDGCNTILVMEEPNNAMHGPIIGRSKAARQARPCYQGPRPYRLSWWCDPSSR